MKKWFLRLREELSKPLPGVAAQLRMSPAVRRFPEACTPLKKSGVLLLLYPYKGSIYLVFIRRAEYKGIHSGQISFPGGISAAGDNSLTHTALREAMEETGMPVKAAKIIGELTPLHIPVSNTDVYPFVATCQRRPAFVHDPSEVQYLIETSIDDLLDPVNSKTEKMVIAGKEVEVPYFDIHNHHIWGATAMILSEFLEIVKKVTRNE